jgi:glutamate synthase (NADPH/NADH) large chain
MTNGETWVWDPAECFPGNINPESVGVRRGETNELSEVRSLIERHVAATDSDRGRMILDNWERESQSFWRVEPLAAVELARLEVDAENEAETGTGAAD